MTSLSRRHILRAPAACLLFLLSALATATAQQQQGNNNAGRTNTGTTTGNRQGSNQQGGSGAGANTASNTRTYRNNTQVGDALIQIDPETRSLIIVADEDTHNEIMKVIKNLDKPKPQVLIKVLFAQVTLDNSSDFGVEGSYAFNAGQPAATQLLTSAVQAVTGTTGTTTTGSTTTTSPASQTTTTTTTKPVNGGTRQTVTSTTQPYPTVTSGLAAPSSNFGLSSATTGGFFRLSTQNATATLYALAQKGKVSVLSRPSILARNNQEAVILVGQTVPLPTSNTIADTGASTQSVQYTDVGIILRVTPFITANRTVEMIVSPEISSLSTQTVAISNNFNAPVINKTSAETVVVTPDATTVVIGGLMSKTESTQVSKIPLLGDIPILGNAFKRTTKSNEKNELVIFMTPYIVEGTERLQELGLDDVNRSDVPKEGFTEKDVDQYLDGNVSLFPNLPSANPATVTTKTTTKKTTTLTAPRAAAAGNK